MLEKRRFGLLTLIILILLLCSYYLNQSTSNSAYSKTWKHSDGSELTISISSLVTSLLVDNTYTYRINLVATTFGPNLDGFYSIAVGLRFTNSQELIRSDLKCDIGDLSSLGASIHILLQLSIPSPDKLSLKRGESIQGQLQYIIYFSKHPKDWDKSEMAPNQWPHESDISTGWETISQGKITYPYIDFISSVFIALAIISLSASGSIIFLKIREKRRRNH